MLDLRVNLFLLHVQLSKSVSQLVRACSLETEAGDCGSENTLSERGNAKKAIVQQVYK